MIHEADLDGHCEGCGLLIGFHATHMDKECARDLKAAFGDTVAALHGVLDVCRDRQAFVMQGPRAFARAENIVLDVFEKLNIKTSR